MFVDKELQNEEVVAYVVASSLHIFYIPRRMILPRIPFRRIILIVGATEMDYCWNWILEQQLR